MILIRPLIFVILLFVLMAVASKYTTKKAPSEKQ